MNRRAAISVPALILAGSIGLFVGVAGVTFRYAEGLSYMSNDPKACVNCHVMRDHYDAWQKSAHHAHATCNDCHVPKDFARKYYTKAEHGWRHSKGFTLQDFHEPIQITRGSKEIVQQNCLRCHGGFVADATSHLAHAGEIDCIHCHSDAGHGPQR